ncbi:uncharacterized protein LOC135335012 [Halichondria panicea]|uniref:uncharacterized protein LOC135335012 n=1 Tax=Halichondria panicea TaxID=6063 RepID=UPI00312B4FDA
MLDSGGGSYQELVYDDQIKWVVDTSSELTAKYGDIPAIAFFHIPSTGYQKVYSPNLCQGTANDTVSPQTQANKLISTLFAQANVRMTVVGHNHGNNWCCPVLGSDHIICYARHTGYGGYGTWMRGSRVLILKEQGQYSTYVRMEDGRII